MVCFGELAPVLSLITLILLTFAGKVGGRARMPGPDVTKVFGKEGSDIILPCFPDTMRNIEQDLFDWRKIGQPGLKEVFMCNSGLHYNNGQTGQDKLFKGRVSHFPEQLKNGNASIIIRNTTVADSGNYTCDFPHLQPRQTFHIELVVVEFTFKDKSAWMDGAAPKPHVNTLDATKDWALLQCDVQGAFPKPKVEWKDRAGNVLRADEKISYRGERYHITLLTTVTKSDHYHCVVKQEEIFHQTEAETFVFIYGPPTGWIAAVSVPSILLLVSVVGNVLFAKGILKVDHITSRRRHENGSGNPPVSHHENGVSLRTEPLLPGSDVPAQQTSPV